MESFYAAQSDGKGGYTFNNKEQIPANTYNRNLPYTNEDVSLEIVAQYPEHPVLFSGHVGQGNFDALSSGSILVGKLPSNEYALLCLLYQFVRNDVPSTLSRELELPLQVVQFAAGKLNQSFENYGCPLVQT